MLWHNLQKRGAPMRDHSSLLNTVTAQVQNATQEEVGSGFTLTALQTAAQQALQNDAADIKRVRPLFKSDRTGPGYGRLFDAWRVNPPSMASLLTVAADMLHIDPAEPALHAAMLAAIAADVPLNKGYHDNHHFREVTAMMAVYCLVHQQLAAVGRGDTILLSSRDLAKCLLASIAHDLLHDGRGNTVDGVHIQYRLENRAIEAIKTFMQLAGMDAVDQAEVAAIIRVTDTTAPKGGTSPHKVLRRLMTGQATNIPPGMTEVALDRRLRQMAALMSDADLTPSAALSYSNARKQGARLAVEVPAIAPTDENQLGFLTHVVEKSFLSAAAQHHLQPSLQRVFNQTAARVARLSVPSPQRRIK